MPKLWRVMPKRISLSTTIAVISALAAIASAFFSYNQNKILRKQLYLHVRPEVSIGLSVFKKAAYFQPVLSVRNRSPVNLLSLSADYHVFQFDKATKKLRDQPTSSLTSEQSFQGHALFQKKLEPNDFAATELGSVISASSTPTPRSIFVFVVFCTHYREGDMERFDDQRIFFFEGGKVFDHPDFMAHADYERIFSLINTVRPPEFASLRDMPAELVLKKPKGNEKSGEPERGNTSNQKTSVKPPSAPSGIRMLFTDE